MTDKKMKHLWMIEEYGAQKEKSYWTKIGVAFENRVDKEVEFGLAANGISGIETALGLVLAAVDAGKLTLARAVEALTSGPARVP